MENEKNKQKKERNNTKKSSSGGGKNVISLLGIIKLAIVVIVLVGAGYFIAKVNGFDMLDIFKNEEGKVTTISKSSLEDVIEVSDLSTIQYIYNSIADVKDEENNVKYHVAYEGKVNAGIDFEKIEIDVNNEGKIIHIKIPPVTIQDTSVDIGKMDYLFEDDDYESESVSQEAYKACKKDLNKKAEEKTVLIEMAGDNAIETVKGLVEPWVKQTDNEYQVKIDIDKAE